MSHVRFTVDWARKIKHPQKSQIINLCVELERLVIPPCNCLGKIWYRKLRHRKDIQELEHKIERIYYGRNN